MGDNLIRGSWALAAVLLAGAVLVVPASSQTNAPIEIKPPETTVSDEMLTVPTDDAITNAPEPAPLLRSSLSDSDPMDIGIEPEADPEADEAETGAEAGVDPVTGEPLDPAAEPDAPAGAEGESLLEAMPETRRMRGEGGTIAVFRGLDKVTARITVFDAPIKTPTNFGRLEVNVQYCDKRPPTEPPEVTAFVEVTDLRQKDLEADKAQVFSGWMFASSPALHAVEHAVYDVWLIDCKAAEPESSFGSLPKEPMPKEVDRKSDR